MPTTDTKSASDHQRVQNYSLGASSHARVGDALIEKGERFYIVETSERLLAKQSAEGGGYQAIEGERYLVMSSDSADGGFYVGGADRKDVAVKINKEGKLLSSDVFYLRDGQWTANSIFKVGTVGEPVFEAVQSTRQLAPQSHRESLRYQGLEGESIRLLYQKYKGGAEIESKDLSFNVSSHNIVRFNNYRLQVKSATRDAIEYVVLTD
ncbi:MAG: hypothetical protein ACPGSC_08365 [Granulosicoccaceae bacterium]